MVLAIVDADAVRHYGRWSSSTAGRRRRSASWCGQTQLCVKRFYFLHIKSKSLMLIDFFLLMLLNVSFHSVDIAVSLFQGRQVRAQEFHAALWDQRHQPDWIHNSLAHLCAGHARRIDSVVDPQESRTECQRLRVWCVISIEYWSGSLIGYFRIVCFYVDRFVVLGAWGNTRIIIRRKRGYEDMTDVTVDDPLATDQPTKFVIEITTGKAEQMIFMRTIER